MIVKDNPRNQVRLQELNEEPEVQCNTLLGCTGEAATEVLGTGITMIPYSAKLAIGAIFEEGRRKYGKNNWKRGSFDRDYQEERAEHAMNHFEQALEMFEKRWYNKYEDNCTREQEIEQLAKAGWFIVTQIDTLRREMAAIQENKEAQAELEQKVRELEKIANSPKRSHKKKTIL